MPTLEDSILYTSRTMVRITIKSSERPIRRFSIDGTILAVDMDAHIIPIALMVLY